MNFYYITGNLYKEVRRNVFSDHNYSLSVTLENGHISRNISNYVYFLPFFMNNHLTISDVPIYRRTENNYTEIVHLTECHLKHCDFNFSHITEKIKGRNKRNLFIIHQKYFSRPYRCNYLFA